MIMQPDRLGSFWAGPLSFTRSLLRQMEHGGWKLERVLLELGALGDGEAQYLLKAGGTEFTFFVLSSAVPEEEKTDRVIGVKWDVMAALVWGRPSADQLDTIRQELPKQKSGRADSHTLVWLRANKSLRSFEHTVAALAGGRQPKLQILQSTGYLMRTTAFYANGKLGTMSFKALQMMRVLGEPYQAQILSAWLLREFVFDLIETMAKHRNERAVSLDQSYRRLIGVGNSAGIGIAPFLVRHPSIIDSWIGTYESLIARIKSTTVDADGSELARLIELLHKATCYFATFPKDLPAYFASPSDLTKQLTELISLFSSEMETCKRQKRRLGWGKLCEIAEANTSAEAQEIVHVSLMEIYPAWVSEAQSGLTASEDSLVDPAMLVSALEKRLVLDFGWALADVVNGSLSRELFWYRSREAGEPRTAARSTGLAERRELIMDIALQARELWSRVKEYGPDARVMDLLLDRPDLYLIVQRVQSKLAYSEVRANLISIELNALPLIRFILAYYGMERFDPSSNRAVQGTLLQGAPTYEDLVRGRKGDWPFAIPSEIASTVEHQDLQVLAKNYSAAKPQDEPDGKLVELITKGRHYTLLPLSDELETRVSVPELEYLIEHALQWAGAPIGLVQEAAQLMTTATILSPTALGGVTEALRSMLAGNSEALLRRTRSANQVELLAPQHDLIAISPLLISVAVEALTESASALIAIEVLGGAAVLPAVVNRLMDLGIASYVFTGTSHRDGMIATLTVGYFDGGNRILLGAEAIKNDGVATAMRELQVDPVNNLVKVFQVNTTFGKLRSNPFGYLFVARDGTDAARTLCRTLKQLVLAPERESILPNLSYRSARTVTDQLETAEMRGVYLKNTHLAPIVEAADNVLLAPIE